MKKKELTEEEKQQKKKISTSKKLIQFLFLNCSIIEIFVGWITIRSLELSQTTMIAPDYTPLVTIVGAVVGEVIGYAIYSIKSTKENTQGGVVYLQAQHELEKDEEIIRGE